MPAAWGRICFQCSDCLRGMCLEQKDVCKLLAQQLLFLWPAQCRTWATWPINLGGGEKNAKFAHLASTYGITMILTRSNAIYGSSLEAFQIRATFREFGWTGFSTGWTEVTSLLCKWVCRECQRVDLSKSWILYTSTNVWCQQMLGIPCTLVIFGGRYTHLIQPATAPCMTDA